jgi:hypothetical protein
VHFAIDFQIRRGIANELQRARIFVALSDSREPKFECETSAARGRDAEALDFLGRQNCGFGDLLGGRG